MPQPRISTHFQAKYPYFDQLSLSPLGVYLPIPALIPLSLKLLFCEPSSNENFRAHYCLLFCSSSLFHCSTQYINHPVYPFDVYLVASPKQSNDLTPNPFLDSHPTQSILRASHESRSPRKFYQQRISLHLLSIDAISNWVGNVVTS